MKYEIIDTSGLGMRNRIKYVQEAGYNVEINEKTFVPTYFVTISTLEDLTTIARAVRCPVAVHHDENLLIIQDGYCRN